MPVNPLGDPPGGVGVAQPPFAQGRSARPERAATGRAGARLSGVMLRLDPNTGAGLPDNPLAGSADQNARRIVAYGLRNPFRMAVRLHSGGLRRRRRLEHHRGNQPRGRRGGLRGQLWLAVYEGYGLQTAYAPAGLASCLRYTEGSAAQPYFATTTPTPSCPARRARPVRPR